MNQAKKRKKQPKKKKKQGLTASTADRHSLYELSVQSTESTIEFIDEVYEKEHGRKALTLREDFCGTAKLCADWISSHDERTAIGLDFDAPTLSWATERNITPLGPKGKRVELLERNVLEGIEEKKEVVIAFNFSYFVFQSRETLKTYFKQVLKGLEDGGLFLMDIFGGPDSQYIMEEETEHEGFTYVWDQTGFDPISNRATFDIHFRFPDKSEIQNAFSYEWRMWTIPELKESLYEVGFRKVDVWWDDEDDVVRPKESAANLVTWIAYIAAWR